MPTTATLAPAVTFSHSGGCPSHFVSQNKTAHNFAPFRGRIRCGGAEVDAKRKSPTRPQLVTLGLTPRLSSLI
jgi:hypothetical protein